MTPESVEELIAQIEGEDRLDFADLCISEQDARHLIANHFCELDGRLSECGLDAESRLEMMTAIAAHTMVENLILHVGRLRSVAAREDFRSWMKRHRLM
jgi:hypothetical protein